MVTFFIKAPQDLSGLFHFTETHLQKTDQDFILVFYEASNLFTLDDVLDSGLTINEILDIENLDVLVTQNDGRFVLYWLDINSLETLSLTKLQETLECKTEDIKKRYSYK